MSFAENSNGFTPSFVSLALSGITHRFILVLECESRQYEGEVAVSHPRFCVGGPRATLDPRNVSITDLLPLGASKVDLPAGWEKVHQLLYGRELNVEMHSPNFFFWDIMIIATATLLLKIFLYFIDSRAAEHRRTRMAISLSMATTSSRSDRRIVV